ncbi:hypothetical protein [Nocardia sp. NPDC051570]|uniref:hypothetical protein n=1 Tax=Nocardia sp. NPDC051570 TaxID=3364324 RepID=UPI0037AA7644
MILDREVASTLLAGLQDLTAATQILVGEIGKAQDVAASSEMAFRIHATDMKQAMKTLATEQQCPRTAYTGMLSDTHAATALSQPRNRRIRIDYTTSDFGEILAAARLLSDNLHADVGAHVAYAALAYSRQILATHNHDKDSK